MTQLKGALMVCGTSSDAGKTTVVTGLCRLLARRGIRVAPFKAQNMALNSAVTRDGHEIGRAQAAQAAAAMVEPEVAMNPILLKPQSDQTSQVIVMGRPWATLDASSFQAAKHDLQSVVQRQLADLRRRFDVVICEGAGSPAEINLLDTDLVNLRLAHAAGLNAILVGDIDRGGVFAALYGTVELLPAELRALVGCFVINKFRGDESLLSPGLDELHRRTGIPTVGVIPWLDDTGIDSEDSLALRTAWRSQTGVPVLDVAAIRLPRISNFTDLDALALEPGVGLRLVDSAASLGHPDLVVIPGTKTTVADLEWLRARGLAEVICERAADPGVTILGICGGYQMLGQKIEDGVESTDVSVSSGLGLLDTTTTFDQQKVTRLRKGSALGQPVHGYEIHHGRTRPTEPWIELDPDAEPEGASKRPSDAATVLGTSIHGLLESDPFRKQFLAGVAAKAKKRWRPSSASFEAARQDRFDLLADAVEAHIDMRFVESLIGRST